MAFAMAIASALWCARARPVAAAGASVESAMAEQSAAASDRYRAGTEAFQAQRYDEALARFRESYALVASPNSHLMVARALSKLGKNAEAYTELAATIREAESAAQKSDKYRKTLESARAEQSELGSRVGVVVVTVQADVTVGGRPLPAGALGGTVIVDPGKTEVVLRLPNGAEERRQIDVLPGKETRVDMATPARVSAAPAAPGAAPARTGIDPLALAAVAGGVGVLGFATFAVFGVLDQGEFSDLQRRCPGNVCPASAAPDAETGRTYQTLANVGLGVGIVGAASGLVLLLTGTSRPATRALGGTRTEVAVGPGTMAIRGRF